MITQEFWMDLKLLSRQGMSIRAIARRDRVEFQRLPHPGDRLVGLPEIGEIEGVFVMAARASGFEFDCTLEFPPGKVPIQLVPAGDFTREAMGLGQPNIGCRVPGIAGDRLLKDLHSPSRHS